jgi:hypothetical protein
MLKKPRWTDPAGLFPLREPRMRRAQAHRETSEFMSMNTLERRRIVKSSLVDTTVVKAAFNQSRRERAEAARKLRKALAAKRYAARRADDVSYSQYGVG